MAPQKGPSLDPGVNNYTIPVPDSIKRTRPKRFRKAKMGKKYYEPEQKKISIEPTEDVLKALQLPYIGNLKSVSIKIGIPRLNTSHQSYLQEIAPKPTTTSALHKNSETKQVTSHDKSESSVDSSKKRLIKPHIEDHTPVKTSQNSSISLTKDQAFILAQQMRQHVQMLTQSFLLTYENPEFCEMSEVLKNMLLELNQKREGKPASFFDALNLSNALELVDIWEKLFASKCKEALECKLHVERVLVESIQAKTGGSQYVVTFPPLVMETIASSNVFLYPRLLPPIPFKANQTTKTPSYHHTESEDNLLALFLEQSLPYLKQDPLFIATRTKKINMVLVCKLINKLLMPHLSPYKIRRNIDKKKEPHAQENPIKYYYQNKQAPPLTHYVEVMNLNNLLPPCKRSLEVLPIQWREFIYSKYHYTPMNRNDMIQKSNDNVINNKIIIIASPMQLVPLTQVTIPPAANPCIDVKRLNSDVITNSQNIDLNSVSVKTEDLSVGKTIKTEQCDYDNQSSHIFDVMVKAEPDSDDETNDDKKNMSGFVVCKTENEQDASDEKDHFEFEEVKIKCEVHEFGPNDIR